MPSPRSGLYDDPAVYDILHTPGTADDVNTLEAIEEAFTPPISPSRRLWLEPACGSGRCCRVAAARGIETIGFDLSPDMIEYALRRARLGPGGEFFVADMTEFLPGLRGRRPTLAFNLINTIRHLPSDRAMLEHFDQVARALAPGGVYVVGISLTVYGCESPSEDIWIGSRGPVRVTQVVQFIPPRWDGNPKPRSELVVNHLIIKRPAGTEERDSTYRLRTYDLEQWNRLIAASALETLACVDEAAEPDEPMAGGYNLFVLRPRARTQTTR